MQLDPNSFTIIFTNLNSIKNPALVHLPLQRLVPFVIENPKWKKNWARKLFSSYLGFPKLVQIWMKLELVRSWEIW